MNTESSTCILPIIRFVRKPFVKRAIEPSTVNDPSPLSTMNDAVCYRWQDLPQDHPMDRLARRRIFGEKMMVAELVLQAGFYVPTHAHENEQIAIVVSGAIRFGIGAEDSDARRSVVVRGGEVLHLPSNVPHSAEVLEETVVFDLFSPPSQQTGVDRVGEEG